MNGEMFREQVLSILHEEFPNEEFRPGTHPEGIAWLDTEISLHNLHMDLAVSSLDLADMRPTIVEHFNRVVQLTQMAKSGMELEWAQVQKKLRLQIMPAAFERHGSSIIFPLLPEVVVSIVVDSDFGYSYVREIDLERWSINRVDAYELAKQNLDENSRELKINYFVGPPDLMAVDTTDGYAAARLLLPELRKFVAGRLGSPFYAGIPNRDFLVMWAKPRDKAFTTRIRTQLNSDFRNRSHPLTNRILVVTPETISAQ